MYKPDSLRTLLTQAVPHFRTNPDTLHLFVEEGRIVATAAASASFEYHYTLNVLVTDYSGDADHLILPIIIWLKAHQPDLLRNPERQRDGFKFEAELLNHTTADISIKLALTESVIAKLNTSGGPIDSDPVVVRIDASHPPEHSSREQIERWELWLLNEKVAEWSLRPDGWPRL